MAYDHNNIFARILRGELPAIKVYEDAGHLAFMDIMPQSEGHTLVIPKVAAETLLEMPDEALASTMVLTKRVAAAVKRATGAPGFAIVQFNGAEAGQTVPHLHFHIIPRWDGQALKIHAAEKAPLDQLNALAEKIRAALGEAAPPA